MNNAEKNKFLCSEFIHGVRPRYIFGTTPYATDIAEHVPPLAFIDDFTTADEFAGLPVIKLNAVPEGAIIVCGIADGRPVSVNRLLVSRGFDVIDYFSFKKNAGFTLRDRAFVSSERFRKDYDTHRARYEKIAQILADELSRETFSRLMRFRLEENLQVMEYFTFRPEASYFEPFLPKNPGKEVFVDAGCFDGSTTLEFIRNYPHYHSVHIFEPEPQQLAAIKETLGSLRDIHYHQCGVSDRPDSLRFTSSGSWSHLDDEGDIIITVDTIDACVAEKTTLIKMDIEGHEVQAIEGARQHILSDHPALAICAYHRVDDYWKIPEVVFSIRDDYQLYMRHYTEGLLETVYYFIPK